MPVLVLLVAVLQSATVNVTGTVVDGRTGMPLARVLIVVEGTGLTTYSDPDGRFSLAAPTGPQTLFVSLVGFALARRELTIQPAQAQLTIPLAEGTGTYTESVTVAADRFLPAEPAAPSQHRLGSADLQNLRGVLADDPLRAVQTLPGVVAGDDLRSEFSVRGSPFSQINMTVDGFATPYILHTVRAIEDYSSSGSVAMINSDSRSRLPALFAEIINVLNRDNVRFNPPSINWFSLEAHNIFEQMVPILPSVGVLFEF